MFVKKGLWSSEAPRQYSPSEVVASVNYFDYGSGQLEDLATRCDNLERILGRFIGLATEKLMLNDDDIKELLGKDYSIKGVEDGQAS